MGTNLDPLDRIELIIDTVIPRMSGTELSQKLGRLRPDLRGDGDLFSAR